MNGVIPPNCVFYYFLYLQFMIFKINSFSSYCFNLANKLYPSVICESCSNSFDNRKEVSVRYVIFIRFLSFFKYKYRRSFWMDFEVRKWRCLCFGVLTRRKRSAERNKTFQCSSFSWCKWPTIFEFSSHCALHTSKHFLCFATSIYSNIRIKYSTLINYIIRCTFLKYVILCDTFTYCYLF